MCGGNHVEGFILFPPLMCFCLLPPLPHSSYSSWAAAAITLIKPVCAPNCFLSVVPTERTRLRPRKCPSTGQSEHTHQRQQPNRCRRCGLSASSRVTPPPPWITSLQPTVFLPNHSAMLLDPDTAKQHQQRGGGTCKKTTKIYTKMKKKNQQTEQRVEESSSKPFFFLFFFNVAHNNVRF